MYSHLELLTYIIGSPLSVEVVFQNQKPKILLSPKYCFPYEDIKIISWAHKENSTITNNILEKV